MTEEKDIKTLTSKDLKDIKLLIFDVDGVIVPRGTKIKQEGNITTLETKKIAEKQFHQIKALKEKGFLINMSSGRALTMLQEMFRSILPYVTLTYENGSATWMEGKIVQHINSYPFLAKAYPLLQEIKSERILGFEPKEMIITIHCTQRVEAIETTLKKFPKLYCIWNGEAYDIGVLNVQTKGNGVKYLCEYLHLKKEHTLGIGDNYNDKELLESVGIPVTADKTRVHGKFFIPQDSALLPADVLMDGILNCYK